MPIIDISNLPPAPTRKMSPEQFVVAADAHVASLTTMVGQLNAAFDQVEQAEANADADAKATAADRLATAADRAAARGSAELAAAYAGAAVWSPATVYPADAVVFSPSTRLLYRRKAAGSSPTDPANDGGNWASVILSVAGNPVWHSGNLNPGDYLARSGGVMTGVLYSNGIDFGSGFLGVAAVNPAGPRMGQMNRPTGSAVLQLGGPDNNGSFEVIDRNWTTQILNASMAQFTYKGNAVWHSGNLNPANYAPLTNPSLPGTFEVYGEAYIRSSFHVLNAAQNGWHTVINRNGGNPSVNAPGGISAPNAVLNRGWLPQGTDFNAVRAPGFYGVEMGGWSGLLLDLGGVGGSTPRMQFWATYGDELYFRAARDADTQFDGIGYAQNRIWHSGNFDAARPSFARVSCGFDPTVDQAIGCSNWFRSSGNSGWYNQTYGGGINMEDSTFVRVSHDKHFLCQQRLFGNGGGQGLGAITVSTAGPSGGRTGDIWIQY